jgi:hypothetical protein
VLGIENVDPLELQKQRLLTAALWATLRSQGIEANAPGRIECYFFAPSDAEVARLVPGFPGWRCEVTECAGGKYRRMVRITTSEVHLSEEGFLSLVDVVMVAAHESSCTFDGFQLETSALRKKPWWKFLS